MPIEAYMFIMESDKFEEIRPYTDDEISAAMDRIAGSTSFPLLASYVFPDRNIDDVPNGNHVLG